MLSNIEDCGLSKYYLKAKKGKGLAVDLFNRTINELENS